MVEATIGVRSPSFALLFLYHLPNNQQQGCMISCSSRVGVEDATTTGQCGNPSGASWPKPRDGCKQSTRLLQRSGHAGETKGSCMVVSACQSCNEKSGREQTVEKDQLTCYVNWLRWPGGLVEKTATNWMNDKKLWDWDGKTAEDQSHLITVMTGYLQWF